jgi:tryptophanyl-tRNA synthetase
MTDETQEQQITAVGNEMSASFLAAKKRSDETLAAIEKNPGKFTMLTGDRPTGRLHLGHYFGSIRERVAMQNRGVNSNIIIADYQVITDRDTTEHIQDNVLHHVDRRPPDRPTSSWPLRRLAAPARRAAA